MGGFVESFQPLIITFSFIAFKVGGFAGLVAAYMVGYRGQFVKNKEKYPPRFEQDRNGKWHVNEFPANNETQAALGVFILWLGWYGFNCGSTRIFLEREEIAARVAVNTSLCPSTSAIVSILIGNLKFSRKFRY
jgi:Amt family ammonium transporter